jgi:hypothetical protein
MAEYNQVHNPIVRDRIAAALGPHHPTKGMQVAMGRTCACGFWENRNNPIRSGSDGLDTHRAEIVLDLMTLTMLKEEPTDG